MSNSKITVVNKTGLPVYVGLDLYNTTSQPGQIYGAQGNAQIPSDGSVQLSPSGSGPFKVGYVTLISGGIPSGHQQSGVSGVTVFNVFAGATVTLATEVGSVGAADASTH